MTTNKCPRCGAGLHLRDVLNSRSRLDNKTMICNPCGLKEAFYNHKYPDRQLPPLNEKVYV